MSSRFQVLASPPGRVFQLSELILKILYYVETPTTKAVGSELVTNYQPTALVVGSPKKRKIATMLIPVIRTWGLKLCIGIITLLFSLQLHSQTQIRKVENTTFQRGEYLKYRVFYDSWITYWMTAGYGTIEVDTAKTEVNGRPTYHIVVNGKSANVFNVFFKVHDKYETFMDEEGLMPLKFIRYTREGGYKKDDTVFFDNNALKARSMRKVKDITPYVQDIVSAFYFVRTWNFDTAEVGDTYLIDFFLDDSLYHSEIIFQGRDWVKTDYGKLWCMKFKPSVAVGEVFTDPYPMEMWVTDDKNKIPVLMKSGVFIGSVKIELVEYRGLKWPVGSH
jgi:hypothetical protein